MVLDPDRELTVEAERLFFRHKISPYLGRKLTGSVRSTLLRGTCVYDGEQQLGEPLGQLLLHRRTAA